MNATYQQARRSALKTWIRHFGRAELLLSFEFIVIFLAGFALFVLQGIRIFEDERIVGYTRWVFDTVRYILAALVFTGIYRLWPVVRNIPAHTTSISRFSERTKEIEEATLRRSPPDTPWLNAMSRHSALIV